MRFSFEIAEYIQQHESGPVVPVPVQTENEPENTYPVVDQLTWLLTEDV